MRVFVLATGVALGGAHGNSSRGIFVPRPGHVGMRSAESPCTPMANPNGVSATSNSARRTSLLDMGFPTTNADTQNPLVAESLAPWWKYLDFNLKGAIC